MSTGSRGVPVFENAVVVRGRVVAAPVEVPNAAGLQVRFTLAFPVRRDKAYYFEVNIFDDRGMATWAIHGDRKSPSLGKGDEVLIKGGLASYSKPVTGVKGTFHKTHVTINAEDIERHKLGKNRE